MKEILRTTDPVKLSYAIHLLEEAQVKPFVADEHMSAIEGSIGAFPRRILVEVEDLGRARLALAPLLNDSA